MHQKFFNSPQKVSLDVISYNATICACGRSTEWQQALCDPAAGQGPVEGLVRWLRCYVRFPAERSSCDVCVFFADSVAGKGDVNIMFGICVARWLVIEVVWMPC